MNQKSIKKTFCIFQEVDLEQIDNLHPNYSSYSGSVYYYQEKGVYRLSNHWGRAANSKWRLKQLAVSNSKIKLGFALWEDFFEDNDDEKLYFLAVNFETKTADFFHKNCKNFDEKAILRTSSNTIQRIRLIRKLLENDRWTKHFDQPNIQIIVINQLIYTDLKLNEIKKLITTSFF